MVHMPLVLSAAIIPLVGHPLLYLPIHIVWLELLIHPSALLAFQGRAPTTGLARLERVRHARLLRPAWLDGDSADRRAGHAGSIAVLPVRIRHRNDADTARTMAIAVLVVASATITAILSGLHSWSARIIVAASILSLVVLVQVPVLAGLLHLQSLTARNWMIAVAAGAFSAAASFLQPGARSAAV